VNNSPYSWLSSGFPNDSTLDGLNAPYGSIPGNDGNAYYRSFRNFSAPAYATPAGLRVTTFLFQALAPTPSTLLSIPPAAGLYTRSYIVDGYMAGLEVTGSLGSATITILPEPNVLAFLTLGGALFLGRRRKRHRSASCS
jgi:hypothetical protein